MASEERWLAHNLSLMYYGAPFSGEEGDGDAYGAVQEYIEQFSKSKRRERRGVWLCGPPGTGKTHLAHLIADAALDLPGCQVRFLTVQGYLDSLRKRMDATALMRERDMRGPELYFEYEGLIQSCLGETEDSNIDLLVLDDVGKEHTTQSNFAEDELERLIRARAMKCLATVVTTNMDRDDLVDQYSGSFDSFIDQAFYRVEVRGSDYRSEHALS